jgi:ribonuclease HI
MSISRMTLRSEHGHVQSAKNNTPPVSGNRTKMFEFDPDPIEPVKELPPESERILAYTDGSCRGNPGVSGFGVAYYRKGKIIDCIWGFSGIKTNNQSEYLALIRALAYARDQGWPHLVVRSDSEMMVKQLNCEYQVRDSKLRQMWYHAASLAQDFESIRFEHVLRGKNRVADALANRGADMHRRPAGSPAMARWKNRPVKDEPLEIAGV